jgi:hypothetical protein
MRPHPHTKELLRYATKQSGPAVRHLAGCAVCRSRIGWIRDVRLTLAGEQAVRAPAGSWAAIESRLAAGEVVLLPAEMRREPTPRRAAGWRVAAVAVLLAATGAAAAYIAPGSPVRSFVERFLGTGVARDAGPIEPPTTVGAPADGTPPATLVVSARDGSVEVALLGPTQALRVRVRWVETGRLQVRATGAAANARFRSGPGRMTVSEATGGELLLIVPRDLRRVAVTVDGVPYVVQQAGSVTIAAPAADTIGGEVVLTLPR